jgi:hypothetical protein
MWERASATAILRLTSFYGIFGFGGGYSVLAQLLSRPPSLGCLGRVTVAFPMKVTSWWLPL